MAAAKDRPRLGEWVMAMATAASPRESRAKPGHRHLILIVEPNPFMAEMERAILRDYEVKFVGPEDLVSAVVRYRPCLVISEILLGGRDGLEICRELKERPDTCRVPVILFSVLDASEEAAEAGADAFLLKPAERKALADEVRRLTG